MENRKKTSLQTKTSERIVKFHSLAQFVSNFSDNSVSSFTVSCV